MFLNITIYGYIFFKFLQDFALKMKAKSKDKEYFNKRFGAFVKHKRMEHSLTQVGLADMVGNNFQNISRLERGEYAPTLFWIKNLAEAFEISLSDLILQFEKFQTKNK